jgi:hypothetical protein
VHVAAVAVDVADDGAADGRQRRGRDEKHGFQAGVDVAVGLGDGVFVLEVGGVAQPAQQKLGTDTRGSSANTPSMSASICSSGR